MSCPDNGRRRLDLAAAALDRAGDAPTRERMRSVADYLLPLRARDFRSPQDGELLEQIKAALTAVADPGEGGDLASR